MKKTCEININTTINIFILLTLLISSLAIASTIEAENKVKLVFGQVETSFISLKSKNEFTKGNIRNELTKYLIPEVNTTFFSNKVLNKNLQKVPEELKTEFISELTIQLINTYSNLLSKYNDETIFIGKGTLSKSGKIAMVNVEIIGKNKTNKAVIKLLKSKEDIWQFFDIVIEGISLIDTKQAEINSSFNKLGAEGALQRLKEVNNRSIEAHI